MSLLPLFKKNAVIVCMLLFLCGFYSLIFYSGREASKKNSAPVSGQAASTAVAETKPTDEITAKDLKAREELFKERVQKRPRLLSVMILGFLFVVASGLLLNVYFVTRRMGGGALFSETLPMGSVPWGLRDVFLVFVFIFFTEAFVFLSEAFLSGIFHWKHVPKDLFLMLNSLIRDILVAGLVLFLVVKKFGCPVSDVGLTAKNFFRNVLTGFFGYWALVPLLLVVLSVLAGIAQILAYEPAPQPVVQMYLKKSTEPYLIYFTIFVALVGPVIEEIFFRGFTYKAFRDKWGARRAMLASSAVFALMHMNVIAFFPIFVLGVFLAYLYEKTGSLVPSMTVHMLHNLIMVSMTLGFKFLSGSA